MPRITVLIPIKARPRTALLAAVNAESNDPERAAATADVDWITADSRSDLTEQGVCHIATNHRNQGD